MNFGGYWVFETTDRSGAVDAVKIETAVFDETELSPDSGFTRAWENESEEHPHGFIKLAEALEDAAGKLLRKEGRAVADAELAMLGDAQWPDFVERIAVWSFEELLAAFKVRR